MASNTDKPVRAVTTGKLSVYNLGQGGVVIDKSALHGDDTELRNAQNAIRDPLGVEGGLKNRPGLVKFNTNVAAGAVLGGIGVPLTNLFTGVHYLYIGRGPVT